MLRKLGAASLIALTLTASSVWAQEEGGEAAIGEQVQDGGPAVDVPAPELPAEILALLNDQTPLSEMKPGDLRKRFRAAQGFAKQQGLSDEIRAQLLQIAEQAKAEFDARKAAEAAAAEESQKVEEQPVAEEVKPQEPAAAEAQPETPAVPADVLAFVRDQSPLGELSDDDLKARLKTARAISKNDGLPQDIREQATAIGKAVRGELLKREAAAKQEKPADEKVAEPVAEPDKKVEEKVAEPVVEPTPEKKVEEPAVVVVDPPKAADDVAVKPEAPPPPVDKKEVQELDGNTGSPEAEAKALAFLSDQTPPEKFTDEELKTRLDGIRDLMAENQLSRKTENALRAKLKAEREVLRGRIAAKKAEEDVAAAKKAMEQAAAAEAKVGESADATVPKDKRKRPNLVIIPQITITTPIAEVLRDRRDPEELTDEELSRRVEVFRDIEADDDYESYDEEDRRYWREAVRRDRLILRERLAERKRQRVRNIAVVEDLDIEIEDATKPRKKPRKDVFEAEADDEDITDVLVSAPRKKVRQRYSIKDIVEREELREAMPRIEIDTIRFGFNEAFVREEEIDNLDRVADVIERILRKNPREVFLVEGHTDAVGSDAYNLKLSLARAEAIKKALVTYYVISPRNLQTAGLGERYLKIPTAEAEAENRRVSISRATPLVGELRD